jgi:Tfp pilus assembly protein PilE
LYHNGKEFAEQRNRRTREQAKKERKKERKKHKKEKSGEKIRLTFVKTNGHYTYHQFNIQELYVLPTQRI